MRDRHPGLSTTGGSPEYWLVVDQLVPRLLAALDRQGWVSSRVLTAILERVDLHTWKRADITESAEIESLTNVLQTWTSVSRHASKYVEGAR